MKINEQCLPCLVNQAIKTANLTNAQNREELYKKIFTLLSHLDFSKTNPHYNQFFLANIDVYDEKIHSIEDAVRYAIVANIIDFNPVHSNVDEDIQNFFYLSKRGCGGRQRSGKL